MKKQLYLILPILDPLSAMEPIWQFATMQMYKKQVILNFLTHMRTADIFKRISTRPFYLQVNKMEVIFLSSNGKFGNQTLTNDFCRFSYPSNLSILFIPYNFIKININFFLINVILQKYFQIHTLYNVECSHFSQSTLHGQHEHMLIDYHRVLFHKLYKSN